MIGEKFLFPYVSSLVCFSAVATANEQANPNNNSFDTPRSKKETESCGTMPIGTQRIEMRHIESRGIGYEQGYTTLAGFFTVPSCIEGSWLPFMDLRGHFFNNGRLAANAGVGIRYMDNMVWGINAYYDYRNTKKLHYNQVGAGLEMLGERVDVRINGYLPVGKKVSDPYQTNVIGFSDHYLMLSQKREFAMKGGNAEVGIHFNKVGRLEMYSALGPYYFSGHGRVAWGGEGRVGINLYDYVNLQVNGSYDKVFKGIIQGEVSVMIPLGKKKEIKKRSGYTCASEMIVKERALQKIDRNEIVVVDRKKTTSQAIDPATGQPYFFWFVDNTSHSLGTYESPFNTLKDAQNASSPNDIIYVFPGDGTDTGMNKGILLKYGQQLLGSGTAHVLPTTVGTVVIPALTSMSPIISDSGFPGDKTSIGGLVSVRESFQSETALAFHNDNLPSTEVSLSEIKEVFNPFSALGLFNDNNTTSDLTTSDTGFFENFIAPFLTNEAFEAQAIPKSKAAVTLYAGNNKISGLTINDYGFAGAVFIAEGSNYLIENNTITSQDSGNGVWIAGGDMITINNNTFLDTDSSSGGGKFGFDTYGIYISARNEEGDMTPGTYWITNNTFSGVNAASGLDFSLDIGVFPSFSSGTMNLSILNNTIVNNFEEDEFGDFPPGAIVIIPNLDNSSTVSSILNATINGNHIYVPSGNLAGIVIDVGQDLVVADPLVPVVQATLQNNASITSHNAPGYYFDNIDNHQGLRLDFSSSNVGSVEFDN